VNSKGEKEALIDCGGGHSHGLPLLDGQEHIYPILIDLLNFLQKETNGRIIVTRGHACPDHHLYARGEGESRTSKHMLGAEVSFYVQGFEEKPEELIPLIQKFYREDPSVKNDKDYTTFLRYEKDDAHVVTPPWYNKEIYVKLFKENEGRNFDNRHPYPYLSIQVRFDRLRNEKVQFRWDRATKEYLRDR